MDAETIVVVNRCEPAIVVVSKMPANSPTIRIEADIPRAPVIFTPPVYRGILQPQSPCPGGVCPTPQTRTWFRGRTAGKP